MWTAGQVLGLIRDIPSCDELLTRMVNEASDLIRKRLPDMLDTSSKSCPAAL
ncbi:Nitronate monooxygenase [compost metagenome]